MGSHNRSSSIQESSKKSRSTKRNASTGPTGRKKKVHKKGSGATSPESTSPRGELNTKESQNIEALVSPRIIVKVKRKKIASSSVGAALPNAGEFSPERT